MTALDLFASQSARDEGIEAAERHADADWKRDALAAVRAVAESHPTLMVDDVWASGLERPREGRAIAGVLRKAEGNGWIETTGMVRPSRQEHCHANPRRVYRSLLYRPNAYEAQNREAKARAIARAILNAYDGPTAALPTILAGMAPEWWDGMATVVGKTHPSDATVALVVDMIERKQDRPAA